MARRAELSERQLAAEPEARSSAAEDLRRRLLADLPVSERVLEVADVDTALLEGGEGPPLVLLHGPGGNATHWARVVPDLVRANRVVVPDLPGQGASAVRNGKPTAERVVTWLGELVNHTCDAAPVVVGFTLGGAIAARFAGRRPDRLAGLVLVDTLGLREFEPAPEFGRALTAFQGDPSETTHELLWRQCMLDLDRVRETTGQWWALFEEYNLELARTPSVQAGLNALMGQFGLSAIPEAELERIDVPTTLIWGRQDRATPLEVAEAASARYGWPLLVIDDSADEPPFEQPAAFVEALRMVLGR
jgi:pimeloyl-ACP methyl ester carboxylesterase